MEGKFWQVCLSCRCSQELVVGTGQAPAQMGIANDDNNDDDRKPAAEKKADAAGDGGGDDDRKLPAEPMGSDGNRTTSPSFNAILSSPRASGTTSAHGAGSTIGNLSVQVGSPPPFANTPDE